VDLQGRLSNPRDSFLAAADLLPTLLSREEPSRTTPTERQRQRRLRDDEAAALVGRRREGETIDSLSIAFGIDRTTVISILRRADSHEHLS
jgi:hypothetical protein